MPTFDTPEPISVTLEIGAGDIRIAAGDRNDTVVTVRPSDDAKPSDVSAAEQTRVEYSGGRLLIKAPNRWRRYSFRGAGESVDVEIELPAGSHLRGAAGLAALQVTGRLGECRFETGLGDIQVEQAGPVQLKTGSGDITVDRVVDRAELATGSGSVQAGSVDGAAVIKNANGDTRIGAVSGDLRVNAANGTISVDHAYATVAAKTAYGDVCLGEVQRGAVLAQTGYGKLDVGVRAGVAAWLDLNTGFGNVLNALEASAPPEPGEETVEVRARSGYGDITVRRCLAGEGER